MGRILIFCESFFFIEICLNFLKQGVDEEGKSKTEPLADVAYNYFVSDFLIDTLAWLRLGLIMSLYDHRFKFFWFVKAIRISKLNYYVRDQALVPIINKFFEYL